ncbi:MAG: F-box protein, partial [Candidatus Thorarchaeota archaeon]
KHLQDKSYIRCIILVIPGLGNLVFAIFDLINNSLKVKNNPIIFDKGQINLIPPEIWMKIFSFLSALEIGNMSLVCHEWKDITEHQHIFKWRILNYYGQNVIDNFVPLIVSQKITWKEVPQYHDLAGFISRILEKQFITSKIIKSDNPKIYKNGKFFIPQNFISHGKYNFSICNLFDVKITKIDSNKEIILKGDNKNRLTHIVIENNFLFCFRTDGMIIQWDYKKCKIIKEIQSEYVKKNKKLAKARKAIEERSNFQGLDETIAMWRESFHVQDGYIVIKYGSGLDNILEIVPYTNPDQNQLIEDPDIYGGVKMHINQGKLYFVGMTKIFVFDLKKKRKLPLIKINVGSHPINDSCIQKNIIYTTDTDKKVHVIDVKKYKEIQKYSLPECFCSLSPITVAKNILFGFGHSYSMDFDYIKVFDLNKKKQIGIVSIEFDENKRIIKNKFKLLEMLITIVKEKKIPITWGK